ncbi:hypothetical protein E2C01_061046 [Portunus trituberculatus]|uniref:Uncharacterized protein n=1 Tax=Portunus trituberculatus TaxID=210409 RepID=A0A5B7H739_PORTR|nr:hypothetical protein [Portunus trituberculatus]
MVKELTDSLTFAARVRQVTVGVVPWWYTRLLYLLCVSLSLSTPASALTFLPPQRPPKLGRPLVFRLAP